MVEELNACGIPDSDILIVTATGTHRAHMGDEQARLLGEDICRRIRVIDHDCRDTAHLVHVGDTSRGTPVWFNSYAMACRQDHHHLRRGLPLPGGLRRRRRMLLPGIAGYETIQRHHKQALNPVSATAPTPTCAAPTWRTPTFSVPTSSRPRPWLTARPQCVVSDGFTALSACRRWVQSHAAACRLVDSMEGVTIRAYAWWWPARVCSL